MLNQSKKLSLQHFDFYIVKLYNKHAIVLVWWRFLGIHRKEAMSSQHFLPTANPTRHMTGSASTMAVAASNRPEQAAQREQSVARIFDDPSAGHYHDMNNGPSAWDLDLHGDEERPRD